MAQLNDAAVQDLLTKPNHAVVSTHNDDGSIHNAVVWISLEDGAVAVNSARGRKWPTNIERDPSVTITVYDQSNPYEYVTITGQGQSTNEGADEHIDQLAKKYIGQDEYPYRQPGEERVKIVVQPDNVRHQKQ
jgi:PPOX class probable F420-dependent enzyme